MKTYRPDIDGLRAVAVGAVVIYHAAVQAGSNLLPGGYVGVDVFFVISGFLITSIIVGELREGRFSISNFWDRRVRRILPALAAVLVVSTILAFFILLPMEFDDYGRSLLATTIFASNIYFRGTVGYFAGDSHDQPLLHTWSLAVEEQFYLFWPIGLLLFWRVFQGRFLTGLVILSWIASFALAAWLLAAKPEAVFYYLPTRAWELLTGAFLSVAPLPRPKTKWMAAGLTATGLALITWAVVTYDIATTTFPGPNALAPCIGAALVIYGGLTPNLVSRGLSWKPLVFVGLLSYGLYLWHWPLLVLAKLFLVRPLTPLEAVAVILTAVAISELSRRYIEQPFRTHDVNRVLKLPVSLFAGAAVHAMLAVIGLTIVVTAGAAFAVNREVVRLQTNLDSKAGIYGTCFQRPAKINTAKFDNCHETLPTPTTEGGTVWVWGDSHARAVYPAARAAASGEMSMVRYRFVSSCSPLEGVRFVSINSPDGSLTRCPEYIEDALADIVADPASRYVVMQGRWTSYLYDNVINRAAQTYLIESNADPLDRATSARVLKRGLERAVRRLTDAGKIVILIEPTPEYSDNAAKCYVRSRRLGRDGEACAEKAIEMEALTDRAEKILAEVARGNPSVRLVQIDGLLCGGSRCKPWDSEGLLYYDSNHLTQYGAMKLEPGLRQALRR